jgi:hypothetical protein
MIKKYYNNFNNQISSLSFKNQILLHIFFFLILLTSTILYCYIFINKFPNSFDNNYNLIIKSIEFGNGPLINNLINTNEYKGQLYGINFYLQKLPLLPIFYFVIFKFSNNFFFFIITKNIITFSLIYFCCFYSLKSINKKIYEFIIFILILFIIPYNLFVFLNYQYSDCLLAALLPSLYIVLISKLKNKYLIASIILFCLYLTKTSMLFLVVVLPLVIIIYEKKVLKKYIILIGPIIAIILWGSYGYQKIDKFVFGSNNLSVNSMGMHLVTHKDFYDYFPRKSIDILQSKIEIPKYIQDEKSFYEYFENKNSKFFSNNDNKIQFFLNSFKKIYFILFDIRRDSANLVNNKFDNSIRYSHIPNKIILNLSIILSLTYFFKNYKRIKDINLEVYYIVIIALIMLPYVAAWATSKHLVPSFIISFYYFYLRSSNYKNNE